MGNSTLDLLLMEYKALINSAVSRVCVKANNMQYEDCLQAANIKVWKSLRKNIPATDNERKAIIYSAAYRGAVDEMRMWYGRKYRIEQDQLADYIYQLPCTNNDFDHILDRDTVNWLIKEIESIKLRTKYAKASLAPYLLDMTDTEISKLVGIDASRLSQIRKTIKDRLSHKQFVYDS